METMSSKRTIAFVFVMIMAVSAIAGIVYGLNPLSGNDWDLDPDGDGLTNLDEFVAQSDPNNADTDGDALPDGWEVDNFLNPNDPSDADADFDYFGGEEYAQFRIPDVPNPYTNYAEFFRYAGVDRETGQPVYYPTDPNNPDTDGDSILDPDDSFPWDFSNDGTSGSGNGGANSGGEGNGPAVGGDGDGDGDGNADDDGDGLTDMQEMALGTDFNNPDTDGDGLIDSGEITAGLDPNDWDTDNDMLIDGVEMGEGDSTDGHLTDTDNDGLPDPWEDNDGDGLLNIEEQDIVLWIWAWFTPQNRGGGGWDPFITYRVAYRFRISPNSNDTDNDEISDDKEIQLYGPGPINKNSRSEYNYHQVTNETGNGKWIPDRWNRAHDLGNPSSGFSKWTEGRYSWWTYWFDRAYEYGEYWPNPKEVGYNVGLFNMNPWLLWYFNWDFFYGQLGLSAEETAQYFYHTDQYGFYDDALPDYSGYTTLEDCLGWQERGPATTDPKRFRWNMYDLDPSNDDTDSDRMEDNWDPRPSIPDDRLDTSISLNRVGFPQSGGSIEWYYPGFGPGTQFPISAQFAPTFVNFDRNTGQFLHDYYGFPYRIIDSTMNKGIPMYLEIIVGIERGHPGAEFFLKGWYSYLNVSITFHNGSIDVRSDQWGEIVSDNVSYDVDDDTDGDGIPRIRDRSMTNPWIYNPRESQYPVFSLGLDDLNQNKIPAEMHLDYFNPIDYVIGGYGPWPGPDDPYKDPVTGKGHSGLMVPFINISNYPDPNALHATGTVEWYYWSTMTFYTVGFHFMVPEGVMAGYVVMDMIIDTTENIHVEESFDGFTGYPYVAY